MAIVTGGISEFAAYFLSKITNILKYQNLSIFGNEIRIKNDRLAKINFKMNSVGK